MNKVNAKASEFLHTCLDICIDERRGKLAALGALTQRCFDTINAEVSGRMPRNGVASNYGQN